MTALGSTSTTRRLVSAALASIASAAATGCSAPRQAATPAQETAQATPGAPAAVAAQDTAQTDQEQIQWLEREARALARAGGCQSGGDCRAAPVGHRPCGGPRDYVVYCARTTDSIALYRKLDQLARSERAYNTRQGLMSTCEFRTPPGVVASGGSCRSATP